MRRSTRLPWQSITGLKGQTMSRVHARAQATLHRFQRTQVCLARDRMPSWFRQTRCQAWRASSQPSSTCWCTWTKQDVQTGYLLLRSRGVASPGKQEGDAARIAVRRCALCRSCSAPPPCKTVTPPPCVTAESWPSRQVAVQTAKPWARSMQHPDKPQRLGHTAALPLFSVHARTPAP